MYSKKISTWLQYTLVGTNRNKSYRHTLLKEDQSHHCEVIQELRQYIQEAHEDARRHFSCLASDSLNPFEEQVEGDPIKGYPEKLHLQTLKGYFGEIFVAIIAQNFSPLGVTNWEVPAFLFGLHRVAFQHIETINKMGIEPKPLPGRTGDDCLAFQRDSSGKIIRVLYCEAKCTADHDSDMLLEAYKKVDESIPVDFSGYIEVLKERKNPSAKQWVDAIREVWLAENPNYERYDLISYICGRHPKRKITWHLESEPYKTYKAKHILEAVETHLYNVDSLIREVYGIEHPPEKAMQPDSTQQDETSTQPSSETLDLAGKLRENLAGATISKSLARLYSEHTLLGAGGSGLVSWSSTETTDRLDDALRLLEAAFAEREGGNDKWRESARRAGEILEWLSHSQLNKDGLPTRLLAAAAYQLAGYPARSSGLLNAHIREENESNILKFLLKAEFPNLLSTLSTYWTQPQYTEEGKSPLSWEDPDELNNQLQQRILKETTASLGILCATMRWGEEPRLENAIAKMKSVGNVLLHGDDRYSWLLAKLCLEAAKVYATTSMRHNLIPLAEKLTDTGVIALERYSRQCYQTNKALAWPSQVTGIEKLISEDSFVLCTPTGSGKTTIAELAILQSLFSDTVNNQYLFPPSTSALLAIYLVPSRALAAEVESKLSRVLRNLNEPPINVTGLYGGTDWGPTDAWLTAGEQTVLICTYEKAEALIRFLGPLFLHRVSLVVLDEAHSIQFDEQKVNLQKADSRALRLETLGSRLFTYLDQSRGRVIALSAMASGIENSLAEWITGQKDAEPAKTPYRSVRQLIGRLECFPDRRFEIHYDLLDGASLEYREGTTRERPYIPNPFEENLPNVEGYNTGIETRLRPYLFWAALHLASRDETGHQHAVLISITQSISAYAGDFLDLLENTWADIQLPTIFQQPQDEEKAALWEKSLRSCEDYFGKESKEYKLLQKGIAVHHGRMPGLMARLLVDMVQEQIVHLVLATSTLSEGVNLPFETILIPSIRRSMKPISVREFGNLVGRAGRPGYGTEGRSLVVLDSRNSARQYRQEYEHLVAEFQAQGQAQNEATQARSPLAELILHLEETWRHIPGVGDTKDFLNWLEQTEPLKAKSKNEEDGASAAIETLDTLDSLLLSGIVELEQLAHGDVSADQLEERLRQIWQRSYAHYAANEESRLQEFFVRRGRALQTKIYPSAHQRRRLYRTGLPPQHGSQLLDIYPSFKESLQRGSEYALWTPEKRLNYIKDLVGLLISVPKYKPVDRTKQSINKWSEVLQWWLDPLSVKKRKSINVSAWYKYVSDNFVYRFNWGLGSIIALVADEALNGALLEPSLDNWSLLGLPWIALWLKELIIWGTLEPVAAYLLSKNLEVTRASAEEVAKSYYKEQSLELDANELLDAATIRDWTTKHYSREKNLPLLRPPDRMPVKLSQDFSKVKTLRWRVFPIDMGSDIHWFDPAGVLLATCARPLIWSDSFLNDYDFVLSINEKTVSSEAYMSFRLL